MELTAHLWGKKVPILAFVLFAAIVASIGVLQLENQYRSEVKLYPKSSDTGELGNLAGQFGGLASLAGISIPGGGNEEVGLALEILKTKDFISGFVRQNNYLIPIFATDKWVRGSDEIILDPEIYDVNTQKWVRPLKEGQSLIPSDKEVFEVFSDSLSITTDQESNVTVIGFTHYSPSFSKQVLDSLVKELNEYMRQSAREDALRSLKFLDEQVKTTKIAGVKATLFQLIEEQTKKLMLTEVSKDYVFQVIDQAYLPEKKAKPLRALIVLSVAFVAGFLACLWFTIRMFKK